MLNKKFQIAVFGLGYIGLPTAALFAKNGFSVVGVDINPEIVEAINQGRSPILEPGLDELVKDVVSAGNLSATTDGLEAGKNSKVMVVIVPTPIDENNKSDLRAVKSACETISKTLKKDDLVIIESTIPPKTCENIIIPLLENSGLSASDDFGLVYTPERALPNNTLHEMTHNARVIGGINNKSVDQAASIYEKITNGKIIRVKDLITAEMVKLMENTYRDTNIALANELAIICENLGIDAIEAINAANHHPRVNIHTPGPGVGGHCLSIDPYFIVEMAERKGSKAELIKTARMINESMPLHVVKLVEDSLKDIRKPIDDSTIGILGIAYKGNVADTRETPAVPLINILKNRGATVKANDPYVPSTNIESLGAIPVNFQEALSCDCVILITDHELYKNITPDDIKNRVFICTRPILNPEDFRKKGVIFKGVGRF
ncbi:MAG: nucleotide sugar dehydrogenase [Methanobacteriaceae archaeon]|nr:nucleotide sugar dehydrogenase [Methanobacteriaceae archaeon]